MKKLYTILFAISLSTGILLAQEPTGRTSSTIVADVLAQSPYGVPAQYNVAMEELMSTGEAGVLQLVGMMKPSTMGGNSKLEYALSGLTNYAAKSSEANRITISNAYVKALDTATDREIQAFIIRQLERLAKDEAVDKLATFLKKESLSAPAASALAAIGSPAAINVLQNELRATSNDEIKADIVNALGYVGDTTSEIAILNLVNSTNPKLAQTAIVALGKVGSTTSLKELDKLSKKANYASDYSGATGAYLNLIARLIEQGDVANAAKAAKSLEASAKKANAQATRLAATKLMMDANSQDVNSIVLKALKDPCTQYRLEVLTHAMVLTNGNPDILLTEVMDTYPKSNEDQKYTILVWLKESAQCPKNAEVIRAAALDELVATLNNEHLEVQQEAALTLAQLDDAKTIAPLADMILSENTVTIDIAKSALASMKGNIADPLAARLSIANDNSKLAILELLAQRRASKYLSDVIALTNIGSDEVKVGAYKALKNLVVANDINSMYSLLNSADDQYIPALQDAVVAALNDMPTDERYTEISTQISQVPADKKYLYYMPLASIPGVESLAILQQGFDEGDQVAKDAAFEALVSRTDVDVAELLLDICKDSSAVNYFDQALHAYTKLVSGSSLSGENQTIYLRDAMHIAKTDDQKKAILRGLKKADTFQAMLFAGQFLDQPAVQQDAAQAVMDIALNNPTYTGVEVEALLNKVVAVLNNPDAGYQREAIRKHIKDNPMNNGYVSMFNGKDLTGWKGLVADPIKRSKMSETELAKAQIKADEQMKQDWFVEDGCIVFDGKGYDNLCTIKQFGDFEMFVDWKLDPKGLEADAGIYLRGTPQVQIWDTARVNVGAQVGSGGLYNNKTNRSTPLKVADNKLGMWNTFYIKMIGDRVTVLLNGELVVDNEILENYWDRNQSIFPVEQIELQAHGSKVYYRDLYIKELERPEPFVLSDEEVAEGFEVLFDGTNMHKWTGNTGDYRLEDGLISLVPSERYGGNLYTKEEFDNFVFRFEFQLTPGANNGVGIRTPMTGDAAYVGMEIQILDHDDPIYATITPLQVHGSVYGVIPAKRAILKPVGEWNYEEIIADGDNIKVTLNGEVIVDGNLKEAMKNGAADGKDHPGVTNKTGHIGFLGHGNPLKFKNIRVKRLK